jgi:membrane-bound ClpP family serine protease
MAFTHGLKWTGRDRSERLTGLGLARLPNCSESIRDLPGSFINEKLGRETLMWVVAASLISLMAIALLVGFHTGPHTHVLASAFGVIAAIWLVVMASEGRSLPLIIVLLIAVLLVSIGVGVLAWKGMSGQSTVGIGSRWSAIEGASGKAVTDLDPEGIVRVRGEDWSAQTLNGTVRAGGRVQVVNARGVHLEVWGEEIDPLPKPGIQGTASDGSQQ